jgi:hypothetical protein
MVVSVPWFSYSVAASYLKLPSFITFFVFSIIPCSYLVSPCTSVLIARPSPLSTYFIDFWWMCPFVVVRIFSICESICCGDPRLPIRNTRYAYNSWSHDQCVMNPHIRVDNRITSSITVPNNKLTIGHMTKYDIAMQGKSTTKQRIPSGADDPRHAYYPTCNWLGDIPSLHRRRHTITVFIEVFLQVWPS